jgi:sec-independent protein translocase protein TatA
MPLGVPELIIILVIVLLVLGPKRLPSLGRQLGGGMREFKDGIQGRKGDGDDVEDAPQRAELTEAAARDDALTKAAARDDERSTRTGG